MLSPNQRLDNHLKRLHDFEWPKLAWLSLQQESTEAYKQILKKCDITWTYCRTHTVLYLAHPLFYLPSWTPYVTFFGMTSLTFHLYSSIFYLLPHHCTCLYHWTHHPLLKFLIHFFQSSTKFIWGKELCLFITQPQDLIHFLTCNRYLANIHRQLYGANFLPN